MPGRLVGCAAGVPELHLVAAEESAGSAAGCGEARHVDVLAADAAIVLDRLAEQRGMKPGDVHADLLAQIPADHVGAVAEAVRVGWSDFELSRMRVVSTALAPMTTTLP